MKRRNFFAALLSIPILKKIELPKAVLPNLDTIPEKPRFGTYIKLKAGEELKIGDLVLLNDKGEAIKSAKSNFGCCVESTPEDKLKPNEIMVKMFSSFSF